MSGSGKTSTSTSSVQIPPDVMARYNAVNKYASDVAQTPYQPYQGQFVAPMTSTQNAAVANVNQAAGQAQPYFTGATESLLQGQQAATPYYGAAMDVYGGAYGLGAQLGQESYGALQGAQAAAQPYNQAATGLALAGTQAVNPTYLGQGAINQYMSPYLNNVVGATMQAMNQQNQEQQSQLTSDAIRSGAFGGDRAGVAAANLAYKQNLANQQTIANLYNTGYGQALGTAQQQQGFGLGAQQANRAALQAGAGQMMGIGQQQFGQGAATAGQLAGLGQQQFGQGLTAGQQIAGLGQGIYGMGEKTAQNLAALGTGAQGAALQGASAQLAAGTQEQQTQQAQNSALYNQFLQQQGYPFQTAQFLANIAMGTGANSGSTTTTTQPTSFFSDKRLKENVHQVGETFDGQPIYRYNYKGQRGTQIGLIAQDVERKHPEAVGLAGGYKTVDYDRATEDAAHRGHFAYGGASMGGGVVPERAGEGFAFGGMVDKPFMSDNYFTHILNRVHGTPIGAGLGGQTQGLNIPQGSMSPGRLAVASPPPAQASTGDDYRHFAENVKAGKTLIDAGTELYESIFKKAHGGAIRGYATNGRVNNEDDASPYGVPSFVPNEKLDIPALKTAPAGSGQSGGLGGDIIKLGSSIAGFASLFSDKRLKENIHQIGKTFDGQPVYRYNYKGHPETQIGLIAQEVERKHPEAVGVAGNYKTVDYGRATEDAAHRGHFAYGGIAPRHGYQAGGQPGEEGDDVNRLLRPEWRQRQYDRSEAQRQRELPVGEVYRGNLGGANFGGPLVGSLGDFVNQNAGQGNITPNPQNIERGNLSLPGIDTDQPQIQNNYSNYDNPMITFPRGGAPMTLEAQRARLPSSQRIANNNNPMITFPRGGVPMTLEPSIDPRTGNTSAMWGAQLPPGLQGLRDTPPDRSSYSPELLALLNRGRAGVAPSMPEVDPMGNPIGSSIPPPPENVAPPPGGVSSVASSSDGGASPRRQAPELGRDRLVGPHPLTPGGASVDVTGVAAPPAGQGAMQPPAPGVSGMPAARPEKADEGSKGSWFSRNQDWLVPLLTGVGTMAASPSRFAGSAFLQGLAGAAGSYGNVQNQMAQRAKAEAETGMQQVGAARLAFTPIPGLGPVVAVIDPKTGATVPMQMSEYRRRVAAGERLQTVGIPSGAPYEGASAANAPIAPSEPAVSSGISFNPATAQSENLQGANYEDQIKQSGRYMESTRSGAEAARAGRFNTLEAASTIANAITSGDRNALSTPGAYAAERAQIANMANTFGRMIGAGDIAGTADTNAAILAKLNNAMAGQNVSAADQRSLQALELALRSQPGVAMPPDAAAELSAHALVHNQRLIDKNAHLDQYVSYSPQGTAYNAATDFDSTNGQEKYNREQQAFKMLMMNPKGAKAIELMKKGNASSQQAEEYLYRNTGIRGLSRYFMSGG